MIHSVQSGTAASAQPVVWGPLLLLWCLGCLAPLHVPAKHMRSNTASPVMDTDLKMSTFVLWTCTKYPSWWRSLSSCFKSCRSPHAKLLFPAYFCWKPPSNNFGCRLAGKVWTFPQLFNKKCLHHPLKAPDKSPFCVGFENLCANA